MPMLPLLLLVLMLLLLFFVVAIAAVAIVDVTAAIASTADVVVVVVVDVDVDADVVSYASATTPSPTGCATPLVVVGDADGVDDAEEAAYICVSVCGQKQLESPLVPMHAQLGGNSEHNLSRTD